MCPIDTELLISCLYNPASHWIETFMSTYCVLDSQVGTKVALQKVFLNYMLPERAHFIFFFRFFFQFIDRLLILTTTR